MIGKLLFALANLAFVGFMANRLYVGLSRREINVKGRTYSSAGTPIAYGLTMAMALLGLCLGLFILLAILSVLFD